jgi:drug/metabolite transporter (DMT)-like permease
MMAGIAFALLTCLSFGTSDFLAGVWTRRIPNLTVLVFAQLAGLVLVSVLVALFGGPVPSADFLPYAVLAGLTGVLGVGAFWRGMAIGKLSLVAPIAAAAAIIPTGFALATGERPSTLQSVAIALIIVGVVVVSRVPGDDRARDPRRVAAGTGMGLVAAVCFGLVVVFLDEATETGAGALWTALVGRAVAVSAVLVVIATLRHPVRLARADVPVVVVIGVLDLLANVFMAASTRHGLLSVDAAVISLHTLVTIVLAGIVLHERLTTSQRVGVAAALVGAVAVTLV